ncbi:MAG: carboxypeptidase-like regulatory domain-containing protein [Rhodothermales bacterium]
MPSTRSINVSVFLLLAASLTLSAEARQSEGVLIWGSVLEEGTNRPLAGVNVFVPNTMAGTMTDADGTYQFRYRTFSPGIVVAASMIGFDMQTAEAMLDSSNEVHVPFRLAATVYPLGEVSVTASTEEWKRNLSRLEKLLFSTTRNGEDCTFQNPEYLVISFHEDTGVVSATADAPLVIHNNALGYALTIHDFSFTGSDLALRQGGEMQFRELEATSNRQRRRWNDRRLKAYRGSTRHFIGALVSGTVTDAEYEVREVPRPGVVLHGSQYQPSIEITEMTGVGADTTVPLFNLSFKKVLLVMYHGESEPSEYVQYQERINVRGSRWRSTTGDPNAANRPYQASWLTLSGGSIVVDRRGMVYGPLSMERFGYWAWERLGEVVPNDYVPTRKP